MAVQVNIPDEFGLRSGIALTTRSAIARASTLPYPQSLFGTGVTFASTRAVDVASERSWMASSFGFRPSNCAKMPARWGEEKLVPGCAQCAPSSTTSGWLPEARLTSTSSDRAETSVQAGAVISGLIRPSRVGPGLLKDASVPTSVGTVPFQ